MARPQRSSRKNVNQASARYVSRHQLIQRMRRQLERQSHPRAQMFLLVALTGGAGFLASYVLLHAGVAALAWRYGLAVAIAYVFFLLLLWLWLRTNGDIDGLDVVIDVADGMPEGAARLATRFQPGGGNFGGGGATARWTDGTHAEPLVELPSMPDLPDISGVADADEAAIPIAVILIVVGAVFVVLTASFSIIYSAPVLFAELLVDGVLSATLYRRLRQLDSRHWLQSALRRTIVPFAATAVLLMAAGWGLSVYAPDARTLGEALGGIESYGASRE